MLLEEDFINVNPDYCANIDIASMLFAWTLEFGSTEEVIWVMTVCIRNE